jgi:hypothetical protein
MMVYLAIWLRREGYESVFLHKHLEEEVEIRTKELQESHKSIQDSIEFASLIQQAVLPSSDTLEKYFSDGFIVLNTLVKTMHFECKALASTNVLKVRIGDEKWKPHNKPNTDTYSMGNKI